MRTHTKIIILLVLIFLISFLDVKSQSVNNCYSTGQITGTNFGSIVGILPDTEISNAYFLEGTSISGNYIGISKTDSEMKLSTFVDLLNGIGGEINWKSDLPLNQLYPILSWQTESNLSELLPNEFEQFKIAYTANQKILYVLGVDGKFAYRIINSIGAVVMNSKSLTQNATISISALPAGCYIVSVYSKNAGKSQLIIVNN